MGFAPRRMTQGRWDLLLASRPFGPPTCLQVELAMALVAGPSIAAALPPLDEGASAAVALGGLVRCAMSHSCYGAGARPALEVRRPGLGTGSRSPLAVGLGA